MSKTCVSRYPQKNDDWIRPKVALFQLNSFNIWSIAMLMFTYKHRNGQIRTDENDFISILI